MSSGRPESTDSSEQLALRRLEREREARKAAERLLEQKSAELFQTTLQAQAAQRRMALSLWASGESIWEWSAAGDRFLVEEYTDPGEPPRRDEHPFDAFVAGLTAEDRERTRLAWRLHGAGRLPHIDLTVRQQGDGCWLRIRGRAIERDAGGAAAYVVGTLKDVSAQREADATLRVLTEAFSNTRDPMAVCDADLVVVDANAAFGRLLGLAPPECVGLRLRRLVPLLGQTDLDVAARTVRHPEAELLGAAGTVPVEVGISHLRAEPGAPTTWLVVLRDLRESRRAAEDRARLERSDPLTGLLNRRAGREAIAERIERSRGQRVPLLALNLDGFKAVNESLGPQAGDALLREVARRLLAERRPGHVLARWDGDEFILVGDFDDDEDDARELANRLIRAITAPVVVAGQQVRIGASVGIALHPAHASEADGLLRCADVALRAAKRAGRGRTQLYAAALDDDALLRLNLTTLLREAVDRDGFAFVAQPRVALDGRILGHELLIRWHAPGHGPVSPAFFIPIAEDAGLIERIGRLAYAEAARLSRRLADAGRPSLVSVNLSPRQLLDPQLAEGLAAATASCRLPNSALELEITESALVADIDGARRVLGALRDAGFRVSLDDFGTGYSSLGYLRELPIDKVKPDRSFVRGIADDERAARLVEGVVGLCRTLGLGVVAEGVETAEQWATLRRIGVDELQGFHFFRPMPLDAVCALPPTACCLDGAASA